MNKTLRNSLISMALIATAAPVIASADLASFRLNYTDANTELGADGATLINPVSALVDEYKYTAESLVLFKDNDNSGGISGGDTFLDVGVLRGDGLNYDSNSAGDLDYLIGNVQLTAAFVATGFQVDALNYIVPEAQIAMYFDAPAVSQTTPGGSGGGTSALFEDLGTFVDGVLVQTGEGGGAGINSPLIPDGALDLTFALTDQLSTYDDEYGNFELFDPFIDLDNISFLTDSNNNQCSATVACGSTTTALAAFFATQISEFLDGYEGNTFAFQTRSDGSAVKIPEPASLMLMGLGLLGFGYSRRARKVS